MRAGRWMAVLVGAMGVVLPAGASQDPLRTLHLGPRDVPGLVTQGTAQACEGGESLTALYDGGYQRYVKAGVVRASRQFYKVRGVSLEIVVHQLKDGSTTTAFLADLCTGIHAKVAPIGKAQACSASAEGSAFGFVAASHFVASLSYDERDSRTLGALLKATGRRLARGVRETKK
jgi:hypothetical protein